MSLTELELLQVVDSIKEKQRGPIGPAGVGIDRIEQYDETGFTLRLTDGSFKRIDLPVAKDGEPGIEGKPGPKGDKGDTGRAGVDGSQGLPGRDGAEGVPGRDIQTAVVTPDGDLLVGLSDGSIINCGTVIGPAGATGVPGATGLTGEAGRDGAAVLSGPRAPQSTDGMEGDHWIDISSAEFGFFKKSGNGWSKLANLRQPAKDPRIGPPVAGSSGSGSGGGGGGAEVHVGPNAPSFPEIGELWYDTNDSDGRMYVWTGDNWEPVLPQPDLDGYAKINYVDQKTERLPYLLETDAVGGATPYSSSAAIQLADNKGDITSVKITGLNGIGISADVDGINVDGAALTGDISLELDNYATKEYSDGKDDDLQNQIDMLSVQKGAAANYDCKSVSGSYNCRPGEAAFDNADANLVTVVGLGSEDKNGILTKTVQVGDIIEYVSPSGADTRFKAVDVTGHPIYMAVEFVSGNQTFVENVQYTVYIYPQNEAGPTKDYVDAQDALKVDRAGDTMKGLLVMDTGSSYETAIQVKAYGGSPGTRVTTLQIGSDGKINSSHLIKTTRNNGYAFEIKPDDATTVSYLHTNGTFKLGGTGEILGDVDITTESGTGVRILGPLKVKATNQTIGGTNVFEVFDSEAKYNGAISSDNNLATKKYVDDNAGGGVEDYTGGSSPPATRDRGTMLITTSNALYIYT